MIVPPGTWCIPGECIASPMQLSASPASTPSDFVLAIGSMQMKEYYSMLVCTPARASLMTGRYVVRYGLQYSIIQTAAPWGLPLTEKVTTSGRRRCWRSSGLIYGTEIGSDCNQQQGISSFHEDDGIS